MSGQMWLWCNNDTPVRGVASCFLVGFKPAAQDSYLVLLGQKHVPERLLAPRGKLLLLLVEYVNMLNMLLLNMICLSNCLLDFMVISIGFCLSYGGIFLFFFSFLQ